MARVTSRRGSGQSGLVAAVQQLRWDNGRPHAYVTAPGMFLILLTQAAVSERNLEFAGCSFIRALAVGCFTELLGLSSWVTPGFDLMAMLLAMHGYIDKDTSIFLCWKAAGLSFSLA